MREDQAARTTVTRRVLIFGLGTVLGASAVAHADRLPGCEERNEGYDVQYSRVSVERLAGEGGVEAEEAWWPEELGGVLSSYGELSIYEEGATGLLITFELPDDGGECDG